MAHSNVAPFKDQCNFSWAERIWSKKKVSADSKQNLHGVNLSFFIAIFYLNYLFRSWSPVGWSPWNVSSRATYYEHLRLFVVRSLLLIFNPYQQSSCSKRENKSRFSRGQFSLSIFLIEKLFTHSKHTDSSFYLVTAIER